jgi:diacylglycerol kinase (ATP)
MSLFINPTAGRGRAGLRAPRIQEILAGAGITCRLQMSKGVGDLERRVCDATRNGADRIIVAGGDGSIHEAVNGLMRSESSAALGIIPTGTGNDFAKACAIPLDWEKATRQLVERLSGHSPVRYIDVGRVNDRFFANGVGIGFDAKVTRVARSYRWPVGDIVYLLAIFRCMMDGIATPELTIRSDELNWRGPVTLANVSNGAWVGGMFHIAPMARNNDGKLELLIAAPVSRLRILSLLPKIIRGTHLREAEITHSSVQRLVVKAAEPVPSHLDGEVQALESTFDIEVLPAALGLL